MASTLNPGEMAPEVTLTTPDGGKLTLSQLRGRPLVLYFYPKDDTAGCTREAQDFSALKAAFDIREKTIGEITASCIASFHAKR